MTAPFDLPPMQIGVLTAPRGPQEGENTFRWATVTSTSPLRVQLDGETAAVPAKPDTLIGPAALHVNDRVWVQMFGRRLIVLGVANFGGGAPTTGRVIMGTTTINSSSTTPVVLATFTLPAAGTYDVTYFARAQLTGTNGWGVAELHDPAGTLVPDSEIFVTYFVQGVTATTGNTAVGRIVITTTGPATYTLRGRSGGAYVVAWTTSVDGKSGVQWIQVVGSATGPTGLTGAQGPPGTGFPPTAFSVDSNVNAYGTETSFAAAAAHVGFTIVTNVQTDGPIASTWFVCETWQYMGPATWVAQYAWSPFGSSTGPDNRRWMRQMYGVSGNTWGPWQLIAGTGVTPFAMAAGYADVVLTAVSVAFTAFTFPAGRFTQAPIVTINQSGASAGSQTLVPRVINATTSGASMYFYAGNGVAVTVTTRGQWIAVQMTPASAVG